MKQKTLIIAVVAICVLLMAGCSQKDPISDQDKQAISETETTEVVLEETQSEAVIVNRIDSSTKNDSEYYDALSLGEAIILEFAELVFNNIQITDTIIPKDTSGVYMYYPDEEGSKFIDLSGSVKNISNEEIDVENITIQFVFDDKYKYEGFVIADAGVMRASDHYVNPLVSVDIHIIADIPDELIDSFENCKIRFGFKKGFSNVRNFEDGIGMCDYKYEVQYQK